MNGALGGPTTHENTIENGARRHQHVRNIREAHPKRKETPRIPQSTKKQTQGKARRPHHMKKTR